MPAVGFPQAARASSARGSQGRRGGDRTARRRRQGAGITVTERDTTALRWIGEQYAARYDTLGVLLGRLSPGVTRRTGVLGARTVAQVVERWLRAGLITRYRLLGRQWVVPTKAALQLVGLDAPVWRPVVPLLAHVHAVGLVRLAVEPTLPEGARWLSERMLRLDGVPGYLPDAAIELPEMEARVRPATATGLGEEPERLAARIAIEVELTRKSASRMREILRRPRPARWQRTIYYAPARVAVHLRGHIARIQPTHRIDVCSLPRVDGATYGGAS